MRKEKYPNQKDLKEVGDEDLMNLYKDGQMAAFQALYLRHSQKVYGYFRGRLKNREQTDDLFQATFLKLHNTRERYDSTLSLGRFLFLKSLGQRDDS